jgi:hypothetical protein
MNKQQHISVVAVLSARVCFLRAARTHAQVDEIPLSRPKRNIARDFADGGGQQQNSSGINVALRSSAAGGAAAPTARCVAVCLHVSWPSVLRC